MSSTLAGNSGREYARNDVLQSHREDHALSIIKAQSGKDSFVLKRVFKHFYDLSMRLASEFRDSRRLRLHTDHNQKENILIYPYFRSTLLALIRNEPEFPTSERKKILRHVGEAIQELHAKDWIHFDVKPDNVLVNWDCNAEGEYRVSNAALGDFDLAFKSENGASYSSPYAIGNVMWRSPEGQTGREMTKASDIFSFGLVCIYAMGGGEFLLLNDYHKLVARGITPEQEILTRHFSYFGPMPRALLQHINDEDWSDTLRGTSYIANHAVDEEPGLRFEQWGVELGPEALHMFSGMTNLDPMARLTIQQILEHPFWEDDDA